MQRAPLVEASGGLDADDRALVQLLDRGRAGVGACRADASGDGVDQVLDAWPVRVEELPAAGYALLEQRLAGPLERGVTGCPARNRTRRGHPEAVLVEAAVRRHVQVARRLVRPREPRANHDGPRAGSESEGDVARVPHSPVGPRVLAELACGGRALEDGGELRAADAGHH